MTTPNTGKAPADDQSAAVSPRSVNPNNPVNPVIRTIRSIGHPNNANNPVIRLKLRSPEKPRVFPPNVLPTGHGRYRTRVGAGADAGMTGEGMAE